MATNLNRAPDLRATADALKRSTLLVAVAQEHGAILRETKPGREYRGTCPVCGHGSKGPKHEDRFSIAHRSNGHWVYQCKAGCSLGNGGDVIDLYKALNHVTFPAAVTALGDAYGVEPTLSALSAPTSVPQSTATHENQRQQAEQKARERWAGLPRQCQRGSEYLATRGIHTVDNGVRFGQRRVRIAPNGGENSVYCALHGVWLPLRAADGTIINAVTRFYDFAEPVPANTPVPKPRGLVDCTTSGMFGDLRKLAETTGPVTLVEGVFDWITARQCWPDRAVLGAHGANRLPWIVTVITPSLLEHGRDLLIVPDNDLAGLKAADDARQAALDAGLPPDRIRVVVPRDEGFDLNDVLVKYGRQFDAHLILQPAPRSKPEQNEPLRDWSTPREVAVEHYKAAKLREVPTGFELLDTVLGGGMRATQTYVLAAGTGQGKTSFTLQLASQHIARGGCVAFWTMEMAPVMLQARAIAQRTDVCWLDILRGEMPEETYNSHVAELESSLRFYKGRDVTMFARGVRKLAQENSNVLVIVDYLQKLATDSTAIREAVTEASEALRILAIELMVPLVCVSSVSREAAKRIRDARDCHPADLVDVAKESGAIEYDAANLWALGNTDGEVTLSLAKNRFGEPKQIAMEFDGATGRFNETGLVEPKSKRQRRELRDRILAFFDDPVTKDGERLAQPGEPLSKRTVSQYIKGRTITITQEIDAMVAEGVLERVHNGYVVREVRPFA